MQSNSYCTKFIMPGVIAEMGFSDMQGSKESR